MVITPRILLYSCLAVFACGAASMYFYMDGLQTSMNTQITQLTQQRDEWQRQYNQKVQEQRDIATVSTSTTTKPDGTTTVVETRIEDHTQVSTDTADTSSGGTTTVTKVTEVATNKLTRYSLFATYPAKLEKDYSLVHVGVAARVGNLPLWVQAEGGMDREFRFGVRVDF